MNPLGFAVGFLTGHYAIKVRTSSSDGVDSVLTTLTALGFAVPVAFEVFEALVLVTLAVFVGLAVVAALTVFVGLAVVAALVVFAGAVVLVAFAVVFTLVVFGLVLFTFVALGFGALVVLGFGALVGFGLGAAFVVLSARRSRLNEECSNLLAPGAGARPPRSARATGIRPSGSSVGTMSYKLSVHADPPYISCRTYIAGFATNGGGLHRQREGKDSKDEKAVEGRHRRCASEVVRSL